MGLFGQGFANEMQIKISALKKSSDSDKIKILRDIKTFAFEAKRTLEREFLLNEEIQKLLFKYSNNLKYISETTQGPVTNRVQLNDDELRNVTDYVKALSSIEIDLIDKIEEFDKNSKHL
ncbi:hypothetical protein K9L97_01885 [Candidatus Woesearchaeota archaeon]|nr:hypothetical protein [Candidatus Woesearchaeota archaeon]